MPNITCVQSPNILISNSLIRACVFQIPTASNQFPILSSPNPYPHYYLQVSMQQTQQFKIYENNFHILMIILYCIKRWKINFFLFSVIIPFMANITVSSKFYFLFLFLGHCGMPAANNNTMLHNNFLFSFFFRESSLSPGCQMNRKIVTLIP